MPWLLRFIIADRPLVPVVVRHLRRPMAEDDVSGVILFAAPHFIRLNRTLLPSASRVAM